MIRKGTAHWESNLNKVKGSFNKARNILKQTDYSFKTRLKDGAPEKNPAELLASAHAGCFTMAVASVLTQRNISPASLDTEASLTMEGLNITNIHLSITGLIKDITADNFNAITKDAEKNCLISKVLNIPITSEAHLKG
jgi:osmotically inducible protein OsmC